MDFGLWTHKDKGVNFERNGIEMRAGRGVSVRV